MNDKKEKKRYPVGVEPGAKTLAPHGTGVVCLNCGAVLGVQGKTFRFFY